MTDRIPKYVSFFDQELNSERERRSTLDGRGQAVVTTSGALVALLSAVGAIVIHRSTFVFPGNARYPLVSALILFVVAAFLGILAAVNFKYDVVSRDSLSQMLRGHWTDSDDMAAKNIATANVITIKTMRRGNNTKAALLLIALFTQLGAFLSLSVAVFLLIIAK